MGEQQWKTGVGNFNQRSFLWEIITKFAKRFDWKNTILHTVDNQRRNFTGSHPFFDSLKRPISYPEPPKLIPVASQRPTLSGIHEHCRGEVRTQNSAEPFFSCDFKKLLCPIVRHAFSPALSIKSLNAGCLFCSPYNTLRPGGGCLIFTQIMKRRTSRYLNQIADPCRYHCCQFIHDSRRSICT